MEKQRRNTLDRFQRLGFGRKSSTSSQDGKSPDKSSKTERLKELTEKLKGKSTSTQSLNVHSAPNIPVPPSLSPPVPPPRRFKHTNSVEKNIPVEPQIDSPIIKAPVDNTNSIFSLHSNYNVLEPNYSAKIIEKINPSSSNIQCTGDQTFALKDEEIFANYSRPESRTIVGSYIQKSIPFRSASFSQVDFSSGKYVKADIANLRHSMNVSKDPTSTNMTAIHLPKSQTLNSSSPINAAIVDSSEMNENHNFQIHRLKSEFSIDLETEYDVDNLETFEKEKKNSDIDTIKEDSLEELDEPKKAQINFVQENEMSLETLIEEEIPILARTVKLQSEELQTATTCSIPIPVYECVEKEWSPVPDQWIRADERLFEINDSDELEQGANVTENYIEIRIANKDEVIDMEKFKKRNLAKFYSKKSCSNDSLITHMSQNVPEVELNDVAIKLDEITEKLKSEKSSSEDICCMVKTQIAQSQQPLVLTPQKSIDSIEETHISPEIQEVLETVAETLIDNHHYLVNKDIVSIICPEHEISSSDRGSSDEHKLELIKLESSPEPGFSNDGDFVEVRKRNSNNDGQSLSGSDKSSPNISPSVNYDEKRRIDKSRRRKGIYIQWPAIENSNDIESDSNETPTLEETKLQRKNDRFDRTNRLRW